VISIEKGIIGIFNKDMNLSDLKDYTDILIEGVLDDCDAGVLRQYVVCNTPNGNDGYFKFDTVEENEKIVALQINLISDGF